MNTPMGQTNFGIRRDQETKTKQITRIFITWTGVKSNDGRASPSLLWTQTQERPLPSHAADPATTSAAIEQSHCHMK